MSATLALYSAEPEAFVELQEALSTADLDKREEQQAEAQMARYPEADLARFLHLLWPEDIDALCQAMQAEGFDVPASAPDLLVQRLWSDGCSAWVDRVSPALVQCMALVDPSAIDLIARRWASSLSHPQITPEEERLTFEATVQALTALRMVAQDALAHGRAVLLLRIW